MTHLIWLHEDALSATHPVFNEAGEADAVFIWDDAYFQKWGHSMKRLMFLYETLCELPVTLYRGDTIETLNALMTEKNADTLYVPHSINPDFQQVMAALKTDHSVKIVKDAPFAIPKKELGGPKRFFQYWKKVQKSAMQKHAGLNPSQGELEL